MFTKFPPLLYKGLAGRDGNLFMSPFSVQVALGMALAGADGETRRQLAKAIDAEAKDQDSLLRAYRDLLEEANPESKDIELAVANAAWVDESYKIKPTYTEALHSFGSDVQQVNYGQVQASCNKINGWVSDKTKTKIDKLVEPGAINSDTRLILTNAIYFKGKWHKTFNPKQTKPHDFHAKDSSFQVPMMNQESHFGYFENPLCQAIEMPYKGLTTSMLVVLPRAKDGLPELEVAWEDGLYNLLVKDLISQNAVVKFPRFKISTPVISLKEPVRSLGVKLAFSSQADFTGIGEEQLKIDDVLHKAFVDVGEEGTEAAAATAVSMMRCASMMEPPKPKVFTADHPFLFVIRNRKTDTILFQGRVVDPR